MISGIWVTMDSGNGLLPDGTQSCTDSALQWLNFQEDV